MTLKMKNFKNLKVISCTQLNISTYKKANGYKPFLYNVTFDFCKYMANAKRKSFEKIFMDLIINNSNINHSCPYDVSKLEFIHLYYVILM